MRWLGDGIGEDENGGRTRTGEVPEGSYGDVDFMVVEGGFEIPRAPGSTCFPVGGGTFDDERGVAGYITHELEG